MHGCIKQRDSTRRTTLFFFLQIFGCKWIQGWIGCGMAFNLRKQLCLDVLYWSTYLDYSTKTQFTDFIKPWRVQWKTHVLPVWTVIAVHAFWLAFIFNLADLNYSHSPPFVWNKQRITPFYILKNAISEFPTTCASVYGTNALRTRKFKITHIIVSP